MPIIVLNLLHFGTFSTNEHQCCLLKKTETSQQHKAKWQEYSYNNHIVVNIKTYLKLYSRTKQNGESRIINNRICEVLHQNQTRSILLKIRLIHRISQLKIMFLTMQKLLRQAYFQQNLRYAHLKKYIRRIKNFRKLQSLFVQESPH